jgi:hypothetical protein
VKVDQQTFVWTLSVKLPGHADRQVAVIARDQGIGQTGIGLAACSVPNDVAILVRTTIAWPAEMWVMRLSDGKVMAHRQFAGQALASVVATTDGTYVAENAASAQSTVIRRVSDDSLVATLNASVRVTAFSGDGSLVLGITAMENGSDPSRMAMIDWRSGRYLWRYDGPEAETSVIAQPTGRDFAIALINPTHYEPSPCGQTPQTACRAVQDALRDVVIVHGDGTTTRIAGRYLTLW